VNIVTNRLEEIDRKNLKIFVPPIGSIQGKPKKSTAAPTLELEAADNPTLDAQFSDPHSSALHSRRIDFICYKEGCGRSKATENDRDVFNENRQRKILYLQKPRLQV